MKKHCSFFVCLFVALSTFLLSCGDSKKPEDANRCKITVAATTGGKVKITEYLETTECVPVDSRIEVVATPDDGFVFTGWYVGNSTEPVSTDAVFTFVATKNTTLTAHFTKLSNLTICSAGNGWVSFKDEAEVMLDVEIVHEEEPLSGGVPELAEANESKELNELESSVEPAADAAPQEPEDSPEDNVEPLPAESSSEETQTVAPDEKPICPLTPEPSVNPVELDKTVDDVVERVTIKKPKKPKKPKRTKKEYQVKKESDAVAEAFKKNGDKTAAKTSSKSSPSKSQSSSSASKDSGLPDIKLTDRKLVGSLAKPKYVGDDQGKIVVDICVEQNGFVIYAKYNRKETDINNPALIKEAEKAAMKTRFSEAVNNKNDQWGTITYNFTKKYE